MLDTYKFSIKGYDLECKSTIFGVMSKDKIPSLKSINVMISITWLSISKGNDKNLKL